MIQTLTQVKTWGYVFHSEETKSEIENPFSGSGLVICNRKKIVKRDQKFKIFPNPTDDLPHVLSKRNNKKNPDFWQMKKSGFLCGKDFDCEIQ